MVEILFTFPASEATIAAVKAATDKPFKPVGKNAGRTWQYLKVEEGHYENGTFNVLRIRNGDETDWGGPRFGATPAVLQTTLIVR